MPIGSSLLTSTTSLVILTQTATNLDIFVTGTFTPGTDSPLGSTAPLGASDHISLNETGVGTNQSISWGATFASPPATPPTTVPEPAPLFLLGTALCIVALLRWRKGRGKQGSQEKISRPRLYTKTRQTR